VYFVIVARSKHQFEIVHSNEKERVKVEYCTYNAQLVPQFQVVFVLLEQNFRKKNTRQTKASTPKKNKNKNNS